MPRMLAYHGYVAMLFQPTLETTPISSMVLSTVTPKWVQDVQDAITYLTEQNPVKGSEHYASAWFDYWLKNDESALQKLTHTLYTPDGTECLSAVHRSVYNFGEGDVVIAGPRLESPSQPSVSTSQATSSTPPASGQTQGGGWGILLGDLFSKIIGQFLPRLAEALSRFLFSLKFPLI
jgi:hypothetical protein